MFVKLLLCCFYVLFVFYRIVTVIGVGPVKKKIICVKLQEFSYQSVKTCVLGAQKNRLIETVLLSTHNICFG